MRTQKFNPVHTPDTSSIHKTMRVGGRPLLSLASLSPQQLRGVLPQGIRFQLQNQVDSAFVGVGPVSSVVSGAFGLNLTVVPTQITTQDVYFEFVIEHYGLNGKIFRMARTKRPLYISYDLEY
jgi:hypothetical protein